MLFQMSGSDTVAKSCERTWKESWTDGGVLVSVKMREGPSETQDC